jgi:hypothetical protein
MLLGCEQHCSRGIVSNWVTRAWPDWQDDHPGADEIVLVIEYGVCSNLDFLPVACQNGTTLERWSPSIAYREGITVFGELWSRR